MIFILTLLVTLGFSAPIPRPVPRTVSQLFVDTGTFEGGSPLSANLENMRFSKNPKWGSERWVLDFSDARTRSLQLLAPEFQVRLTRADKLSLSDGKEVQISPQRLLISLSAVKSIYLPSQKLQSLLLKSGLVKSIRIYPPIEDGDRVIEFVFKRSVVLEPHQPLQKEGRLVLDLKPGK